MSGLWRILAIIPAILTINAVIAGALAAEQGDREAVMAFALTAILCGTIGVSLWVGERGMRRPASIRSALALMLIVWLGTPALAAIPLLMAKANAPFMLAYADAMAQLTTTGGEFLSFAAERKAILYWRGSLQWFGGYLSILLALTVLAPLNLTGPGVYRSSLLTVRKDDLTSRISSLSIIVLIAYGSASAFVLVWLILANASLFNAVIGMFGAVSTGGILPNVPSFDAIAGRIGAFGGAIGMLVGATSFAMHWELRRGQAGHRHDPETLGVLFMAGLAALALFALGTSLSPAILNGISLATTYAAPMTEGGMAVLPLPVMMAFVLVGGAALSTAGGVKVIRFLLLFRYTSAELFKLSHPSAMQPTRFRGQIVGESALVNLWVYVLGYAGALGFLIIAVSAFGSGFEEASNAAVAALSNAGPAFLAGEGGPGDFSHLHPKAILALSAGMALGRFEILAVLALLSPEFWRE